LRGLTHSDAALYDDRGSELFEDITKLDEYYPTRTETVILRKHSAEMAAFCGPNVTLLEYRAGAGIKTEILVSTLRAPRLYVLIDIAGDFLDQTVARFRWRFPGLPNKAIVADFTASFAPPIWVQVGARVAFFPGSAIGNLDAGEVATFLQRMRRHVGVGGRAIIGVDLKKDLNVLLRA
jgi:L-histidine Nalpha-methyltransferase